MYAEYIKSMLLSASSIRSTSIRQRSMNNIEHAQERQSEREKERQKHNNLKVE